MISFKTIYNTYYSNVLKHINYKINDYQTAEELTNDVFMRVYKHLPNYDSNRSTLKTWIFNISKNIIIDYFRKENNSVNSKLKHIDIIFSNDKDHNDKDHNDKDHKEKPVFINKSNQYKNIFEHEFNLKISNLVNTLPNNYKRIAELFFFKEYTYNEISIDLEIPIGTVKGSIFKIRKLLSSKL